jgi:hypothetical protein
VFNQSNKHTARLMGGRDGIHQLRQDADMSVVLCSPEFVSSIDTDSCKCSRHRFTSQPCTPFKEQGQLEDCALTHCLGRILLA